MFCFNFRVKNMTQMWLVLCEGTWKIQFSVNKSRETASYSNTCSISELKNLPIMLHTNWCGYEAVSVTQDTAWGQRSAPKGILEQAVVWGGWWWSWRAAAAVAAELEPSYLWDSRVTVSSGNSVLFMNHFSDRHVWVLLFSLFNGLSQSLTHNAPAEGDRDHRSIHQSINQSRPKIVMQS